MTTRLHKIFAGVLCAVFAVLCVPSSAFASADTLITDYTTLLSAVAQAKEGDTLLVGDIDFTPTSPDVPYSMMCITVERDLTIKSGLETPATFHNGGFLIAGSKVAGETLSVTFENIIFDGKADQNALTEADYEYPYSEAEQTVTYYAPRIAQQALSFKGNVAAAFSGCTFRNYMHEYGPVIDIRYGDYTDNAYLLDLFGDHSTCRIDLDFTDCSITNNTAKYDGGAIYIEANHNVRLHANNTAFVSNRSAAGEYVRGGGAIFAVGADLSFEGSVFADNLANHTFSDTVLREYDTNKGGALCLEDAKLTAINTRFTGNRASMGGALSFTNAKAEIDGCSFEQNRAEAQIRDPDSSSGPWSNMSQGGALYAEGMKNDTIALYNCEIINNSAAVAYGGIYGYFSPHEDPTFGSFFLKMNLCSHIGNTADAVYDFASEDAMLWLSHPGDMFTNPHLEMFGCYVVDETFAKEFAHHDLPTAENGYNLLIPAEDDAALVEIPQDVLRAVIGTRYEDKLKKAKVGSNYAEDLYIEKEEKPQPEDPSSDPSSKEDPADPGDDRPQKPKGKLAVWIALAVAIIGGSGGIFAFHKRRSGKQKADASPPERPAPQPVPEQKQIVLMRYAQDEIERFVTLVPEVGTLTGRELEVLKEVLKGKKQSEVAYYLGIEVSTVKDYYKKIYGKLKVGNKNELFVMAANVLKK